MVNPSGVHDPGRTFEQRAIEMARSIHDPSGLQGSVIVDGSERDGLFIDERAVFAYEFTILGTKSKAQHDGQKLADLLVSLGRSAEHRYKVMQGRFITQSEPTADQRAALAEIARRCSVNLVAMSLVSLRKEMIDTEEYLRLRLQAPFGSAGSSMHEVTEGNGQRPYVASTFRNRSSNLEISTDDVFEKFSNGGRVVVGGDFGIGKSAALAHIFSSARKAYFKDPSERRFPIHINLRELRGLRSAREVLTRHCEEIGFYNERALVAAWRAGCCDLLLDGFDELVPANYVGGVRDLAAVRKLALAPVRELIRDSPRSTGIVVAGRTQYFSSHDEVFESLGLGLADILDLQNFSEAQVRKYLGSEADNLPEWVPTRPVLLQFWMRLQMDGSYLPTPGDAWREFIVRVAEREGERVQSITVDNLLRLITGVAMSCQTDSTIYAGVSLGEMAEVFRSVFGREPDDEGIQTLMRLPGLVPVEGHPDRRRFIDEDLEDAAFGMSMADYIISPDSDHRLNRSASWTTASGGLVAEVAAAELAQRGVSANQCIAAIKSRMRQGFLDAPLLEVARSADVMGAKFDVLNKIAISGIMVPYLNAGGEGFVGTATYSDCLIDELDLSSLDLDADSLPLFNGCSIHLVTGQVAVPARLKSQFNSCDIEQFSTRDQTTDGILDLRLPAIERVGLTILKKIYLQKGSGRKLTALSKGLPLQDRELVNDALERLVAMGLVFKATAQSTELVLPERKMRAQVLQILENMSAGIPGF